MVFGEDRLKRFGLGRKVAVGDGKNKETLKITQHVSKAQI